MKYFLVLLISIMIFSCSVPVNTEKETIIEQYYREKIPVFCNELIFEGDCWSTNVCIWNTETFQTEQAYIKIEVEHIGGDVTENITFQFRENENSTVYSASSSYGNVGIVYMMTDSDCNFQWRHTWGAEEARLITARVKITWYL